MFSQYSMGKYSLLCYRFCLLPIEKKSMILCKYLSFDVSLFSLIPRLYINSKTSFPTVNHNHQTSFKTTKTIQNKYLPIVWNNLLEDIPFEKPNSITSLEQYSKD